jgi:hypothetical protein
MRRPLGNTQWEVLRSYYQHGMFPGGGWYWDNYSGTMSVTKSLVKRGLVEQFTYTYFMPGSRLDPTAREMTIEAFHITPAGTAAIEEHFPNIKKYRS